MAQLLDAELARRGLPLYVAPGHKDEVEGFSDFSELHRYFYARNYFDTFTFIAGDARTAFDKFASQQDPSAASARQLVDQFEESIRLREKHWQTALNRAKGMVPCSSPWPFVLRHMTLITHVMPVASFSAADADLFMQFFIGSGVKQCLDMTARKLLGVPTAHKKQRTKEKEAQSKAKREGLGQLNWLEEICLRRATRDSYERLMADNGAPGLLVETAARDVARHVRAWVRKWRGQSDHRRAERLEPAHRLITRLVARGAAPAPPAPPPVESAPDLVYFLAGEGRSALPSSLVGLIEDGLLGRWSWAYLLASPLVSDEYLALLAKRQRLMSGACARCEDGRANRNDANWSLFTTGIDWWLARRRDTETPTDDDLFSWLPRNLRQHILHIAGGGRPTVEAACQASGALAEAVALAPRTPTSLWDPCRGARSSVLSLIQRIDIDLAESVAFGWQQQQTDFGGVESTEASLVEVLYVRSNNLEWLDKLHLFDWTAGEVLYFQKAGHAREHWEDFVDEFFLCADESDSDGRLSPPITVLFDVMLAFPGRHRVTMDDVVTLAEQLNYDYYMIL